MPKTDKDLKACFMDGIMKCDLPFSCQECARLEDENKKGWLKRDRTTGGRHLRRPPSYGT